ncbi:MAG: Ferredoxin [Anaerolineales bacterium]|nr:Ferredoxin [Anaerolineales bacterium]
MRFEPTDKAVEVRAGSLIGEAAHEAGIDLNMPCGGQGRCGRCAVIIEDGTVRRRSSLRLSDEDIAKGYALACQTVIEGDAVVMVPPQEKIERRLTTDKTAAEVTVPFDYDPLRDQPLRAVYLEIEPPSLADQTDDWSRLQRALRREHNIDGVETDLPMLRRLGSILREADWRVTAVLEMDAYHRPDGPPRLVDVVPGNRTERLYGVAIDIGTTSNVVYLVDLLSGRVEVQRVDYNAQIARGEDVISRIIYAGKNDGLGELQSLVLKTLSKLLERVAKRARIETTDIYKATVSGNSTMLHLFLAVPPESIRLTPYITTVNQSPAVMAGELGLDINPNATVDCLPGVASYVGADITAGVVSSGMADTEKLTLFMDIGTNGETVLGTRDWLIACACSAGPAFEGAGVEHGMRATLGAIEEVWIHSDTFEPTYRVIGEREPKGICGSGLLSLLAELFVTGILDKSGDLQLDLDTPRIREGEHGDEYVVVWADETDTGGLASKHDIVITEVDIDNLLRAKAAIYAGYTVLAESVGVDPALVEQVLIGGAFGQYINIEKAIQIGLLPDMPWEQFHFLGNTSVRGSYMALLSRNVRQQISEAAGRMTYLELSADNTFYDQFTSALFLPHTDIAQFPSVEEILTNGRTETTEREKVCAA